MFFDNWSGVFRIVLIGILSYVSLIVMVRLSGKRTLSKMNAFDFTVSIALGSTFSAVILDKQIPLAEGLTAFAVLIGMQFAFAWLASRSKQFRNFLSSSPHLLYYKGVYMENAMKRTRISRADIHQAARSRGMASMNETGIVILESNGKLSIIPTADELPSELLEEIDKTRELDKY